MHYSLASLFGLWNIVGGDMNLIVTLYLNVLKEFQMFLKMINDTSSYIEEGGLFILSGSDPQINHIVSCNILGVVWKLFTDRGHQGGFIMFKPIMQKLLSFE